MARPPVLSGEIPIGGAIELLREVELQSITGVLRFESPDASGEVVLFGGEIAVEQPHADPGHDPVDELLAVESGTYEVHQRLPPLPVSRGDDYEKRGSLAVHVPADLLNYCEMAGLSGVLELTHEGQQAKATYSRGELLAIELDGEDADLSVVFAWERGRFRVRLDAEAAARVEEATREAPPEVPEEQAWSAPQKGESTRQFLRVVEMALADVTHESEKARSPSRTSPPLPPPPKARPRPPSIPAPPRRRRDDQTVRLIFLSGDGAEIGPPDRSTRHVGGSKPEIALPEARPSRRATPPPPDPRPFERPDETESAPMAKKKRKKKSSAKSKAASAKPKATEEVETAADHEEEPEPAAAETAKAPATKDEAEPSTPKAKETSGSSKPSAAPAPVNPLAAFGWAAAVFALGLVILSFLAAMPPVSCPPGRESCGWGTGCVEVAADPNHCGGCGQVCAAPNECRFGDCEPPSEM
ncbi:MAG: hypothetical protein AB8I08_09500 [Sandaracinaceae bacterium]